MGKFGHGMKADKAATENEVENTENTENVGTGTDAAATEATKAIKSIVPSKYAGKYKDPANDDALRTFIKEQTHVGGKVDLAKFYDLCLANGVASEQVEKYRAQTDAKQGGAAGRAVMTLRNLMTAKARKGDGMVGLDGQTYDVKLPPAPTRTAAATEASPAPSESSENEGEAA